eukprot:15470685-Alexandrium_andersonii.AAC.1
MYGLGGFGRPPFGPRSAKVVHNGVPMRDSRSMSAISPAVASEYWLFGLLLRSRLLRSSEV